MYFISYFLTIKMSDASDESNIIHTTKTEKLSKINKNWKSLQLPNKIAIKKMLVEAQLLVHLSILLLI